MESLLRMCNETLRSGNMLYSRFQVWLNCMHPFVHQRVQPSQLFIFLLAGKAQT
jgi:hypothetical protein